MCRVGVTRDYFGWKKARFLVSSTRPTWFCAPGQNSCAFEVDARADFCPGRLPPQKCVAERLSPAAGLTGWCGAGHRRPVCTRRPGAKAARTEAERAGGLSLPPPFVVVADFIMIRRVVPLPLRTRRCTQCARIQFRLLLS